MLGVWLSKEDHDKLEQFLDQFAVGENARAILCVGKVLSCV
jgi:hypothetical protein